MAAVFRFCYKVLGCSCSWDSHQCYASIADAATKASVLCFVLSFWSSVHPYFSACNLCPTPTPKMFVLLHKNSNKISVKLTGANHYHELSKWLYFLMKLEKGQRSRIWQNVGILIVVTRFWHLGHEFTNFTAQTKTDAIMDTVSHKVKDFRLIVSLKTFSSPPL